MKESIAWNKQISWPSKYEPKSSKFFVHNEIFIQAGAEEIWQVLINAQAWPNFYKGASKIQIDRPDSSGNLGDSSCLNWQTMGLQFASTIREYEPNKRLAWESVRANIQGYHTWLIISENGGHHLITEESQKGWLTFFEKTFQAKKLKRLHQDWLIAIKQEAELNAIKK